MAKIIPSFIFLVECERKGNRRNESETKPADTGKILLMTPQAFTHVIDAIQGYTELGMLDEAWGLLESLPTEQKLSKPALLAQLRILQQADQWTEAAMLSKALSALEPESVELLLEVAFCRWKVGTPHAALSWLEQHRAECKYEADFHLITACCYASLEQNCDARAALQLAYQLNPDLEQKVRDEPVFAKLS